MTPPLGKRLNSSGLVRDLDLLDLLASRDAVATGLRVTELAERSGRDKAVVSRTLATLAEAGLVQRDPETRAFRLGPRLFALAARTTEATLVQRSRSLLRQMAISVRETSHLCVLRGGNVLTLISEVSPLEMGTISWAGSVTAAWRTPSGRALISDWDPASVAAWYSVHGHAEPALDPDESLSRPFPLLAVHAVGERAIKDLDSLNAELASIRRRGYALSDEEFEQGVIAASAPVRDAAGSVIAALNVSAPKSRLGHRLDDVGAYVAKCAGVLSAELGWQPGD